MAEVWAARNVLTHRDFAVKFILPSLAKQPEVVDRFLFEARATGRLRHPCIVDVFDVGRTAEGQPFIVMELLAGESLEARLTREQRLSPLTVSLLFSQVARGLERAHEHGIVHRDLSSANVFLVSTDGGAVPKILDFGVSKLVGPVEDGRVRTGDGMVLGSPGYMSPEQAQGAEGVDARTDVWALGVLMYECLAGTPPFSARNYNALMLSIMTAPHRPLGDVRRQVPAALVDVVESCLIKDREARTARAIDVAHALDDVVARLSRGRAGVRVTQRRRVTDRQPIADARPTPVPDGARLPAHAFPVGVRLWQMLSHAAPPRGVALMGGAVGGTALGLALGVLLARPTPAPLAKGMARVAAAAPRVDAEPGAVTAPKTAQDEPTDLVTAARRGLGLASGRSARAGRASRVAALDAEKPRPLRDNPYE